MATVTRENISLLNDKITVSVSKEDYLPSFDHALKQYGKKANLPGFRKGMVPSSLIKKMYGASVLTDEVLRTVEKELANYMETEKLQIFAQPLPLSENDAKNINIENPSDYAFAFEVGLKPGFDLPDLESASLTRYKVELTDEMINEEIERLRLSNGKTVDSETVTTDENILKLKFIESDEAGNENENGISKENTLLVKYFKEDGRKQWMGKRKDDQLISRLSDAFESEELDWILNSLSLSKESAEDKDKFFKLVILSIAIREKAELNEEFYNKVFPGKGIKTEEEFNQAVKESLQQHLDDQAKHLLQHEVYHFLIDSAKIEFPESFLKRWLKEGSDKARSSEQVEEGCPHFINQLKWTLITSKIFNENNLEIKQEEIKALALQQLAGYMGMNNLDENQHWVAEYINKMMNDRRFVEDAYHRLQNGKVLEWAETKVKPVEKEISTEEFRKLQHQHQH